MILHQYILSQTAPLDYCSLAFNFILEANFAELVKAGPWPFTSISMVWLISSKDHIPDS